MYNYYLNNDKCQEKTINIDNKYFNLSNFVKNNEYFKFS